MEQAEQSETGQERALAVPTGSRNDTKAERRAARALIGNYHEAQLAGLIERVREAFARYDAGEIDTFDFDDAVHQYKRAAHELWKFCVGGGAHVLYAARTLDYWKAEGDLPDWWDAGAPRPRR